MNVPSLSILPPGAGKKVPSLRTHVLIETTHMRLDRSSGATGAREIAIPIWGHKVKHLVKLPSPVVACRGLQLTVIAGKFVLAEQWSCFFEKKVFVCGTFLFNSTSFFFSPLSFIFSDANIPQPVLSSGFSWDYRTRVVNTESLLKRLQAYYEASCLEWWSCLSRV